MRSGECVDSKAMTSSPRPTVGRPLRVLHVATTGVASDTLSTWLGKRELLDILGPVTATAAGVDATFDKFADLEGVTALFEQTRKALSGSPTYEASPIET